MAKHVNHTSRGVVMPRGAEAPGFVDVGHKSSMSMPEAKSAEKKYYPSLHLDKHIPGLDRVKIGEDAVIVAKVRLTSVRKDEHGASMGLEVREVKDINPGRGKVGKVMGEYKRGSLRSSSGAKVTSRKQAIAIGMSEAGLSRKKKRKRKS